MVIMDFTKDYLGSSSQRYEPSREARIIASEAKTIEEPKGVLYRRYMEGAPQSEQLFPVEREYAR